VVADLFVPARRFGLLEPSARPALVLAMGIKTAPKDRPIILGFADTLARLGFVVLWPRLKVLDQGVSLPEEPETFVLGVRYLESLDGVDRSRISLVGFSVGASTALVAAHHPEIADRVRAVVFFGGYYDAFDYLLSLATRTSEGEGETIAWTPADEAVGHMREIFAAKEADGLLSVLRAGSPDEARSRLSSAPEEEMRELRRFSPAHSSGDLKARLFILHDTGDPYVPYLESAKLHRALSGRVETTYLVTNLFDHVQPRAGLSVEMLEQAVRLYGFVHAALGAL
jgi:dipeptidyl aminopeptidase/acylaminoacyl peptidase